jgi:hypothetical protein
MRDVQAAKGGYKGFRATGALMRQLSMVDASVSGAVMTEADGVL